MKNDPRSHGLWETSAAPGPPPPSLHRRITVNAAIVGAGFTGLSAALHLQQKGIRTAVIEADEIGFGASGRNVGLVNAGLWVMPSLLSEALGELHGNRLLTQLGAGPDLVYELIAGHGIECEAVRNGTLHCAVGASGLRSLHQRAREWQARGAARCACASAGRR